MKLFVGYCEALTLIIYVFPVVRNADTSTIKFILNPGKDQSILKADDAASLKSALSSFKALKIYTHGFASSCVATENTQIPDAYRKNKKDCAAMCVDWASLSYQNDPTKYPDAVKNTFQVGKRIAEFLRFLLAQDVIQDLNSTHLIGWSLGGHVMGVAGGQLNGTVGRITGLDPAGPLFDKDRGGEKKPLSEKLDKTDALYVDCIHTNAGLLGTDETCGHAEYYPNGGKLQLKCPPAEATKDIIDGAGGCNHARAPVYFAKSIPDSKYGRCCKCDSWTHFVEKKCKCKKKVSFGENSKPGTLGTYYLRLK